MVNEYYRAAEEDYLYHENQGNESEGINQALQIEKEAKKVQEARRKKLIKKLDTNIWLSNERDYPKWDYSYNFTQIDNIKDLFEYFQRGNRAIRAGVLFEDLAFVNQVNAGDEWLALRDYIDEWKTFESISFEYIASKGFDYFKEYIGNII